MRSALIVGIWFVGVLIVFPMLNYYFDRVNADLELWIKQVALDLSRSGWNQPGSWLKTFGAKIKVFDIAAFAVALSLSLGHHVGSGMIAIVVKRSRTR
ncbi:hypothetical protein OSJ57_25835 [Sphingomonas sp. HH69]